MKNFLFILTVLVCLSGHANGEEIVVYDGEVTTVPVDTKVGTLLEFPKSIRVVGDSLHFKIEEVVTSVDKKSGKAVNVNIVKIRPKRPSSSETVPFILKDKKSISLRFVAMAGSSRHHKLRYPWSGRSSGWVQSSGDFLAKEITLMKRMLLDKSGSGFTREITDQTISVEGFEDQLSMRVVRKFRGSALTGYSIALKNISDGPVLIHPEAIRIGQPGRAALMQADKQTLSPCSDEDEKICHGMIRIVMRDENFTLPGSSLGLPFSIKGGEK
jgi:hypothetical protein